jgi:hypothetical protein
LEDQKISLLRDEKVRDFRQTLAPVDVPVDDPDRFRWPELPSARRKIAGYNVFHIAVTPLHRLRGD